MTSEVRERSREILRAELAEAAAEFCAEHGFDEVTADDIAQGIGVSRATFFRYFGSKEDAVVVAVRNGRASVATALSARPVASGESAWAAVRASLDSLSASVTARPDGLRARARMIGANPGLRARLASGRADDREALATVLTERLGDQVAGLAVASAAMGAIDLAWRLWVDDEGADFEACLDTAFSAVAGAASARFA